jgi:hypothetical protein
MSTMGTLALVLTSSWLAGVTLLLILVIRQIGLLTVRLDHIRSESIVGPHLDVANDGPEVGSGVPEEVLAVVPECRSAVSYLLLVSATCSPCRELVQELRRRQLRSEWSIVALVPGPSEVAESLIAMFPVGIRCVRDPEAAVLARQQLRIQSTPFVLQIEAGTVTGKAYLYNADDLLRFIESRATSNAGEIARRASAARKVVGHVA